MQYRGTNWYEATFESRLQRLRGGRCAYPGLRPAETLLEAGLKRKNRDEFINATVRVRCRVSYQSLMNVLLGLYLNYFE